MRVLPSALALAVATVAAAVDPSTPEGHVFRPVTREPTAERIRALSVPRGFRVDVFARGFDNPRMIAVAPDGAVWVTLPGKGEVVRLEPGPDGASARTEVPVRDRPHVHGIAIHDGALWLVDVTDVWRAPMRDDGSVGPLAHVATVPGGGGHTNRTLAFGPDGALYVSIGSTCNVCVERDPEHATILRMRADGSERRVFAVGLRNTVGFAWHPVTGQLWGMDHGSDWLGDDEPPEELNRLVDGGDYGWPFAYGDRRRDPRMWDRLVGVGVGGAARRGDRTPEAWLAATHPPVLGYTAHAAPMNIVFYTGTQFPAEYRNDAFVSFRGSWNRKPASGYEVARVRFRDGAPERFEGFLTGFLVEDGAAQFARVAGLAVAADGSLLVVDDENGVIYRVHWVGDAAS